MNRGQSCPNREVRLNQLCKLFLYATFTCLAAAGVKAQGYLQHPKLHGYPAMTGLPSSVWQTRYDREWENSPPHVRQWFKNLMQPDHPRVSCCGEADSYEADLYEQDGADYIAIITGQGPAVDKLYIPEGTRLRVPSRKIKWDDGNPTGHGIIFVGRDYTIYCYIPPAGI
jgi:hypothetical protein